MTAKIDGKRILIYVVLILFTVLCLAPFFMLIINATHSHPDIQKGFSALPGKALWNNLNHVLHNDNLPVITGLVNSMIVSVCTAALSVYFSALTAYGIHVYNFKYKTQVFSFILLIMLVPSQISALGFIREMMAFGLMDSFIPLIIPAVATPATVFFMKQYLESTLSLEIVEASRIDGAGEFRTYNSIIIPLMKPAFAVQGIFSFVYSWNNYFLPSLLLESKSMKTLPILIAQLRSADFLKFDMGQIYMLITLAILPTVIVYILLSKNIVGGIALGGVKG
ncbi:MAG: carbohydrate ABC transporter permease [Clostridiales Family XIII bacterium]|jgi:multiple sugar transport system permease protein|nr:carbohydrate ABC transporter permease [Clostridiales Family XIII bacterium]